MNRRWFILGLMLVANVSLALSAAGQDSGGSRSLVDRLRQIRDGWGRESEQPQTDDAPSVLAARQSRQAVTSPRQSVLPQRTTSSQATSSQATTSQATTSQAAATEAGRYPRVNASQLLPEQYRRTRSTTAVPITQRQGQPLSSNAEHQPLPERQPARTAALPKETTTTRSTTRSAPTRSLGDAYLQTPRDLPLTRTAEPSTGTAESELTAPRKSTTPTAPTTSRPSPVVRRTPKWSPPEDFDADELRSDLVDSSDRTLASQDDENDQSLADENESFDADETLDTTALDAETIAAAQQSASAAPRKPLGAVDESDESDESFSAAEELAEQQLAVPSANPFSTQPDMSAQTVMDSAETEADTERVQQAGERAFSGEYSTAPQVLAPAQPGYDPNADVYGSGAGSYASDKNYESAPTTPPSDSAYGRESFLAGGRPSTLGENILTSNRMPMISSHVSGPSQILIGREAKYTLQLSNQSNTPAQQVVAEVHVPDWAEVVDTSASSGIIQLASDSTEPNTFRWQLQRLGAQGNETLDIRLIPRSSRPLELGVDWSYAPVGSRTVVEVQEPKIRMHVSGPDEVLYGKPQLYRLTLTNPGTGVADDVEIHLLPPGGGEETVSSHFVGELAPGTSKSVEVELTAREAGKLFVKASATAAGGITADGTKDIFCRKPELEIDWRGPEQKYAGTAATYYLRVRNPGTAAADGVSVGVRLPEGVEFLTASEGQVYDPDQSAVLWRIGSLRPGDDYYMELKCQLNAAGVNGLEIKATTADGELTDAKSAETNVIALADLKLEVGDPKGPVPVGQEAVYEIRVRNRGTNTAEQVNIVALFSEGIDAESVEGAQYSIADGRVTFRTIEKLDAGREVVLKIRARAKKPGTHIFRAEVLCRDLEIQLAAEETTRFFQDESFGGGTASGPSDASTRSGMFQDTDGDGGRY